MLDIKDSTDASNKIPYSKVAAVVDRVRESGIVGQDDLAELELTLENDSVPVWVRNGILPKRSAIGMNRFLEYINDLTYPNDNNQDTLIKELETTVSVLKNVVSNAKSIAVLLNNGLSELESVYVSNELRERLGTTASTFKYLEISKLINNRGCDELVKYTRIDKVVLKFILALTKLPAISLYSLYNIDSEALSSELDSTVTAFKTVPIPTYRHMDMTIAEYLTECLKFVDTLTENSYVSLDMLISAARYRPLCWAEDVAKACNNIKYLEQCYNSNNDCILYMLDRLPE